MPDASMTPDAPAAAWTCPFCPLLCDGFDVDRGAVQWRLVGSDCPRAQRALSHFGGASTGAPVSIDGRPATLDEAVEAAAELLAASGQPLFGGLATDVAGARALYRLACACGAISDAATGPALMHTLRALQDRGQFTTTLAEVRTRADVIVCLGTQPGARYPEFFRRIGIGEAQPLADARHVAFVGTDLDPALGRAARTTSEAIALEGDLYDGVAQLAALVARRHVREPLPALAALADRLRAARYAVLVVDTAALPEEGALILELVERLVATLNVDTRAALLVLGGADGSSTVNQVHAWLSGLPLRTRAGALGLEHEPLAFETRRVLDGAAADALLWVSSYGPEPAPPDAALPRIVLAYPAAAPAASPARSVFIAVATPGIGSSGHLFRTDGVVLLPLSPVAETALPSVASVAARIEAALRAKR
ncbi:MAG TPA: formylmethanofuran dehydrogenase [Ideonella sp.]|nr:formylmethanofuran dehydrogenase [Ideonella sp.]